MARKFGKPGRKKQWKTLGLEVKQGARRTLAGSTGLKRQLKTKKGVLLPTYRLIEQNFKRLLNGEEISDKKIGVAIRNAHTGKFGGQRKLLTLKVSVDGKEFFVKVFERLDYINVLKGIRFVEHFLKRRGYTFEGEKIRVIKPHLFYESVDSKRRYLVTDFFSKGEVEIVECMPKSAKRTHIIHALNQLYKVMDWKHDIFEIAPHNAFYNPAADTVLLFDLQQFKY